MENKKDLGSSLIETLGSSEFSDILQDVAEVTLDSVLTDGPIKDIPIVGTIVRLGKAAITVRDYFLIKKILIFLNGASETTLEQRVAFTDRIETDQKHQQRVGETILLLLDRYDHLDKASLMAKVYCACVREEISYDEFLRISTAIDRAFIDDLNDLLDYFSSEKVDLELKNRRNRITQNLYTSDFSDFYVLTEEQAKQSGLEYPQIYHFNQHATKFAEIVLKDKFHGDRW